MLCELAQSFPLLIAKLLERDRSLKRNFREETVTDLLMASLVGLSSFGINVHFPDEPTTGGDMEWYFVAPDEPKGGRCLRMMLQAKRARFQTLTASGYWFYDHLDHGAPPGEQARTLMSFSAKPPDGKRALPFYIFYHPSSALKAAEKGLPAIDGINLVLADRVASVVMSGCGKKEKKVSYWRGQFLPLSDIFCWHYFISRPTGVAAGDEAEAFDVGAGNSIENTVGFHPDLLAQRLLARLERTSKQPMRFDTLESFVADEIPPDVQRAIMGNVTDEDRRRLRRPRVIFSTSASREDPEYKEFEGLLKAGNL
jgi:uncharacterized protein DUF6615